MVSNKKNLTSILFRENTFAIFFHKFLHFNFFALLLLLELLIILFYLIFSKLKKEKKSISNKNQSIAIFKINKTFVLVLIFVVAVAEKEYF